MNRCIVSAVGLSVMCASALASVNTTGGPKDSLLTTDSVAPLMLGVDFEHQVRAIKADGEKTPGDGLTTKTWTATVGLRVLPWLTPYGTIGSSDVTLDSYPEADGELVWSLGVNASVWEQDIRAPKFMEGRVSLRLGVEWLEAETRSTAVTGDWTEWNFSALLGYEIFSDRASSRDQVPYSLELYVGPVVSLLDGDMTMLGHKAQIEQDQTVLVVTGVDIYLARNLSIGVAVWYGDNVSWRVGTRYCF